MKLKKRQFIGDYEVVFPLSSASDYASCRARSHDGRQHYIRLFPRHCFTALDADTERSRGESIRLLMLRDVKNVHLITFEGSFFCQIDNDDLQGDVYSFIGGETLASWMERNNGLYLGEAERILHGVMQGVKALHAHSPACILTEIHAEDIMLDFSENPPRPIIIDFPAPVVRGYFNVRRVRWPSFSTAPEVCSNQVTEATDVYALAALMYEMLFGIPPYFCSLPADPERQATIIEKARRSPLRIHRHHGTDIDEPLMLILEKALAPNPTDRYQTVIEFEEVLLNRRVPRPTKPDSAERVSTDSANSTSCDGGVRKGGGFAEVAGMDDLKQQLRSDIIDVLKAPDKAKKLGIGIPNGILLYGPPGCGKTFIAEKFAEESGFWYMYVKCSDIASPYIHGGQGKIADIFNHAQKHAPAIVFFDEIEAMIRDRSLQTNTSEAGEVNEFLAQLNNCGERGIFVIGATNKPHQIDSAALRAGRLEYKYWVPLPDVQTRELLFRLTLEPRSRSEDIDCALLAKQTEGYVSSDIRLIVDKAARRAFQSPGMKITMDFLKDALQKTKPSISNDELRDFSAVKERFEAQSNRKRNSIGFI